MANLYLNKPDCSQQGTSKSTANEHGLRNSCISDLMTDGTISLDCSFSSKLKDTETNSRTISHNITYTVDEILANSFVPEVGNSLNILGAKNNEMSESNLRSETYTVGEILANSFVPKVRTSLSTLSVNNTESGSSSFPSKKDNFANFRGDSFVPAKTVRSKLLYDEICWAQENAAVPISILSAEARKIHSNNNNQPLNSTLLESSFESSNKSVGRFFAKRSAAISDIVGELLDTNGELLSPLDGTTMLSSSEKSAYSVKQVLPEIEKNHSPKVDCEIETLPVIKRTGKTVDYTRLGNACNKSDILSMENVKVPDSDPGTNSNSRSINNNPVTVQEYTYLPQIEKTPLFHLCNVKPMPGSRQISISPLSQNETVNKIKTGEHKSNCGSHYSNNSGSIYPESNGIPIKVTKLKLSWNSVKLRTDSQRLTSVKNISNKRLTMRMKIEGPGFNIVNPVGNKLTLLPGECRTIVVNFSPTMTMPAIGSVIFQRQRNLNDNYDINQMNNEFRISCYAYGGHARIILKGLFRGPIGDPFLLMGEFCPQVRHWERSFEVYNKGPLEGFASIFIEQTELNVPGITTSIKVHPEYTLIEPNDSVTIRVIFEPKCGDLKKIQKIIKNVLTIAKIRIVYGDEPTRQRLRQIQHSMPSAARSKVFPRSLDVLWTNFAGEKPMLPYDWFRDSKSVAQDMLASLSEQVVALTLDNNELDETSTDLSTIFSEEDNILFQSMCESSLANQLDETYGQMENTQNLDNIRNIDLENVLVD